MNLSLKSLLIFVIYPVNVIALWWSLESSIQLDRNSVCKRTQALLHAKTDICRSKPDIIKKVLNGINQAVDECQYQFQHRRWNCSTNRNSVKKIVQQDYRETAFIFAITSAGISYYVTRACSMGKLEDCRCRPVRATDSANSVSDPSSDSNSHDDQSNQVQYDQHQWRGCRENLDFGSDISKQFMNNTKSRDPRTLVINHNNRAGRMAVQHNMQKECKCHGLSGTCSKKTCWQKLPTFRQVSDSLKARFDGASRVIISNKGKKLLTEGETIKPPTKYDLVYTTKSPAFCVRDPKTGSLGTQGRVCNASSKAIGGCELLCCDHGFKSFKVVEEIHCKCRFHWCCVVKCQTCRDPQTIYRCNP